MPKLLAGKRPQEPLPAEPTTLVARVERKAKAAGRASPKTAAAAAPAEAAHEQVIADAVRLVQWGRKWFELPELIARMAGRPPLAEVRRLLKENKSRIDEKAGKN
jgi:hypothetical protein